MLMVEYSYYIIYGKTRNEENWDEMEMRNGNGNEEMGMELMEKERNKGMGKKKW